MICLFCKKKNVILLIQFSEEEENTFTNAQFGSFPVIMIAVMITHIQCSEYWVYCAMFSIAAVVLKQGV